MSGMAAGWYPDPADQGGVRYFDGQRWTEYTGAAPAGSRRMPAWVWVAVAALLISLVLALAVVVKVADRVPSMPDEDSGVTPATVAPRSQLLPGLEFPPGTTRFGHPPYGPDEFWTVPLPYAETAGLLRRSLPVDEAYDGLPWCTEFSWGDELTIFSWGDSSDYLSVQVSPGSLDPEVSTLVSIGREPYPTGCRR